MNAIILCGLDTPIFFILACINLSRFVVTGCAATTSATVPFPSFILISLLSFCFNLGLKCCLIYELEMYQEVKGRLPKVGESFHIPSCEGGKCGTSGCAMTQSVNVPKERITVTLADGARTQFTAAELGVSFQAIPAHTKGVGTYGSDEVPKQERPTPVSAEGEPRRRRRRRGRRRGGRGQSP